jgi:hypothetical protein
MGGGRATKFQTTTLVLLPGTGGARQHVTFLKLPGTVLYQVPAHFLGW